MQLLVFVCFQLFFLLASPVSLATSLLVSSGCSKSILLSQVAYQPANIAKCSMLMIKQNKF